MGNDHNGKLTTDVFKWQNHWGLQCVTYHDDIILTIVDPLAECTLKMTTHMLAENPQDSNCEQMKRIPFTPHQRALCLLLAT